MPPPWIPFLVLSLIIALSALRLWLVTRQSGVSAYGFGRHAAIQGVAERLWRLAVLAALALSAVAWLAPDVEAALGRPDWALFAPLRWVSAIRVPFFTAPFCNGTMMAGIVTNGAVGVYGLVSRLPP